MATAKIADTGIDLAGIANLANLFLGKTTVAQNTGGTQTTGTRTVSENVDPAAVQATVKSILEGTSGLAAVSSGQRKAGLYNSSTNQLLTNDLVARTAAEASKLNKTTTTSVNEGTADNRSTTTVTQPPISSQTAGKGALLLGGLSLIPADVKKNLLNFGKKVATANAATSTDAQAIFRKGEIGEENAADSTAAIVSNPVSGNSGTNSVSGVGIGATGNDANIVSLGGDDGSGLTADVLGGDTGSSVGFLDDLGGSALVDSVDIDPGIVGDVSASLPDFDYDNWDLGFARGGQVRAGYAEGGPVNIGLRNRASTLMTESDPTDFNQVVGSLNGRLGGAGERTTGGTRPTNTVNSSGAKTRGADINDLQPGSTSGDDTDTNNGSVGSATQNAAVINGLAPMLAGLLNPVMGIATKAAQALGGVPTQSINPISQIVTALANAAAGNDAEAPEAEGTVSVGAISGMTGTDAVAVGEGGSTDSAPDTGTSDGGVSAGNAAGDSGADGATGSSSDGNGPGSDSGGDSGDSGGDAGYTQGGSISGQGTSTSDSIPISVSDGEFVMNAEAVKAFGPIIEHMNNLGRKMMDKKSGYARGGIIKMGRK